MKLSEIQQLLSTLLADSSTNFYTESERLQAINLACSYINGELRLLRNVVEITMTPLDNSIPIPQDFVSLGRGVQWRSLTGQISNLEMATPQQLVENRNTDWEKTKGIPTIYVMEGSNLFLTPKPNETGIVVLSYLAMPNKLVQPNDLPFYGDVRTQSYHDMIAFYAAWMLTLKDRDFEAAQQFIAYFQTRMIDLKENLRHTGSIVQPVWSDTYSTA